MISVELEQRRLNNWRQTVETHLVDESMAPAFGGIREIIRDLYLEIKNTMVLHYLTRYIEKFLLSTNSILTKQL